MKTIKLLAVAALIAATTTFVSCSNKNAQQEATETETVEVTEELQPIAMIGVVEVADNTINAVEGQPYILDFNATWCGPCQAFKPVFEAAAEKYDGKLTFYSIDTDNNPELANEYKVEAIPTIVGVSATGEVSTYVGSMTTEELDTFIQNILGA